MEALSSAFSSIGSAFGSGAAAEGAATAGEGAIGTGAEGALAEGAIGTGAEGAIGTAGEAAATSPGFWSNVGGAIQSAMPYVNTASQVVSLANMAKNALSGAPGQPQTPTSQSTAPLTPPIAPTTSGGVSPTDYEAQQKAYFQQLFAGTGQGLPGGELPQDIQDMIARNASLIR